MGEMEELLARVEKATGPDPFLGLDVVCALFKDPREFAPFGGNRDADPTASLDAALALVKRVRPNEAGVISFGGMWSRVDFIDASGVRLHATCRTPALALLAALLRALIKDQTSG